MGIWKWLFGGSSPKGIWTVDLIVRNILGKKSRSEIIEIQKRLPDVAMGKCSLIEALAGAYMERARNVNRPDMEIKVALVIREGLDLAIQVTVLELKLKWLKRLSNRYWEQKVRNEEEFEKRVSTWKDKVLSQLITEMEKTSFIKLLRNACEAAIAQCDRNEGGEDVGNNSIEDKKYPT